MNHDIKKKGSYGVFASVNIIQDIYEGFCVYDLNEPSEENVIFEGATKLPFNKGKDHFIKVHDYWANCLQEIIYLLPDAQWDIHIDDTDVTQYFDYPK